MSKTSVTAALVCFLAAAAAAPACAEKLSPQVAACFRSAGERYNIPAELLVSIAEVESGLKPWAINRAGTAIVPRTLEQAEQSVEEFGRHGATFDVGIMQVNRWWFEKYGEPYSKGLDPCFSIDFGARILAMSIKDHGFTWQAVGSYHSPTGWRQEAYARKIFPRLTKLLEKRRFQPLLGSSDETPGDVAYKEGEEDSRHSVTE